MCLLMAAMAQAKTVKRYSIETGMIEYEVNGGGNVLGVVSEIKGSNTLYFKNYLAKQFGLNDDEFSDDEEPLVWNENTKKEVLADLKEGIQRTEQMMPCIEKAQNMMDMMKCNQGM